MWHATQALTESKLEKMMIIAKRLIHKGLNFSLYLIRNQSHNILKVMGQKYT